MVIDFKFNLNDTVAYGSIHGKVIAFYKYKEDKEQCQIEWVDNNGSLNNTWKYVDELVLVQD